MAYGTYRPVLSEEIVAPAIRESLTKHSWPSKVEITDPHYHDSQTDDYFHPSTHTLFGERALYSTLHPEVRKTVPPKDRDYGSYLTPLFGTVYHTIVQQNLIHDGMVGPEDVEIALIDEERHWRGHADLMFNGELVDLKTMNSRSIGTVVAPYNSWVHQLHPYMDKLGLKKSLIVVLEMGMPWRIKEFRIKWDNQVMDYIYQKWENVREAIKNNEIPLTCCTIENSKYCPLNCRGKLAPQ